MNDPPDPWSFDRVLAHERLTVVSRDDARRVFVVRVGALPTPVTLVVVAVPETGRMRCVQSHALVTPLPHRTKRPGIELRDPVTFIPGFALYRVLDAMTREYGAAVRAGHAPEAAWLVPWDRCR